MGLLWKKEKRKDVDEIKNIELCPGATGDPWEVDCELGLGVRQLPGFQLRVIQGMGYLMYDIFVGSLWILPHKTHATHTWLSDGGRGIWRTM